jgi:hypothetical protein
MPQQKVPSIPSYRLHKPTGLAVVRLNGQDFYLGRHGEEPGRTEYERLISEWLANGRRLPLELTTTPIEHLIGNGNHQGKSWSYRLGYGECSSREGSVLRRSATRRDSSTDTIPIPCFNSSSRRPP